MHRLYTVVNSKCCWHCRTTRALSALCTNLFPIHLCSVKRVRYYSEGAGKDDCESDDVPKPVVLQMGKVSRTSPWTYLWLDVHLCCEFSFCKLAISCVLDIHLCYAVRQVLSKTPCVWHWSVYSITIRVASMLEVP